MNHTLPLLSQVGSDYPSAVLSPGFSSTWTDTEPITQDDKPG